MSGIKTSIIGRRKRKPILCKLGFHSVDKERLIVNYSPYTSRKQITSRSAFCKRCNKKLYRVDPYGVKKEV